MSSIIIGAPVDLDAIDEKLLGAVNVTRLLGIPLEAQLPQADLDALDRALRFEWLRLFDIRHGRFGNATVLAKLFYLTDKGQGRLREIKEKRHISGKLNG